jgi:hypothetical protein
MNRTRPFRPIHRVAGTLAALAAGLLAITTAAPGASALPVPPGDSGSGTGPRPLVHTVIVGGMPGWQIALIAAATAVVAAAIAVILDRAARRHQTVPSA